MLEVELCKIQYLFYFVPYRSLEKSGVQRPFSSILGGKTRVLAKMAENGHFPVKTGKLHAPGQIPVPEMSRNDPF